ncbi:MAG: SpoIID/LytB domain-containing protein [Actinobacteria bacterium]|nr:SpoIID/LytB domain-containing protein [Actinomycetota bacterium]
MKRSRLLLVLSLVALVGSAPGRPAVAAGSFTFFGSGYGHGVGMSQYGALGMAQNGSGYKQILTQFFTGTTVEQHTLPGSLRVGLFQGEKLLHLHARNGPVELHLGSADGTLIGTIPRDGRWNVRTGSGHFRILDGRTLVGGHGWGGPKKPLIATYADGAMVQLKESGGISYNRGYVEFNIYSSNNRGRAIAVVGPQEYLYGLGEVPSSWPPQAMMAQAVAARTYAFEIAKRTGQHQSWCNCAVTDDTRNQVYVAWAKDGGTDGDRWVQAVDRTKGEVVLYQGNLVQAYFGSSSGGYTENNENVWNGTPIPYLRGVCDPGDYTADNPNRVWRKEMTSSAVTGALASYTGNIGTVRRFIDIRRGVSGRIISLTVVGSSGRRSISGYQLKSGIGLLETKVWINSNRNVTGAIRAKYDGINCRAKLPTTRQQSVAGGRLQRFANGQIFFKKAAGAHWLKGPVLDYYLSHGGPGGSLGFPTSDVSVDTDGRMSATFQGGKVVCPVSGSCSQT